MSYLLAFHVFFVLLHWFSLAVHVFFFSLGFDAFFRRDTVATHDHSARTPQTPRLTRTAEWRHWGHSLTSKKTWWMERYGDAGNRMLSSATPRSWLRPTPRSTSFHWEAPAPRTRYRLGQPPKLPHHECRGAEPAHREQPGEPLDGAEHSPRPGGEALASLDLGRHAPHHHRRDGKVADALDGANEPAGAWRQPAAGSEEGVLRDAHGGEGHEGGGAGSLTSGGEGGGGGAVAVHRGRAHPRRPPQGGDGRRGGGAAAAQAGGGRSAQAAGWSHGHGKGGQEWGDRHRCNHRGRSLSAAKQRPRGWVTEERGWWRSRVDPPVLRRWRRRGVGRRRGEEDASDHTNTPWRRGWRHGWQSACQLRLVHDASVVERFCMCRLWRYWLRLSVADLRLCERTTDAVDLRTCACTCVPMAVTRTALPPPTSLVAPRHKFKSNDACRLTPPRSVRQ